MKLSQTITCAFAVAFACSCLPSVVAGEEASGQDVQSAVDPELREDLAYIEALVEANMPDIAEPVIAATKKKWPGAGPKLRILELRSDMHLGRFDAAQKEIDALKGKKNREAEYWMLRLSMADAYDARGKMPECRKIYDEFFQTVTKPGEDLLDLYVESGFRWAQISAREKDYESSVGVYGKLLTTLSERDSRWCNVALAAEELVLRLADDIPADTEDKAAKARRNNYLKLASAWVDKLLWKRGQPLVFGKAITMMAHIEMLKGKPDEAQSLVNNYMQDLNVIHGALMAADRDGSKGYVRASPMPECRYLLAKMLWDAVQAEAKKPKPDEGVIKNSLFGARVGGKRNGLGAYNHALNVAVNYADSVWAPDAADLAEEIEKFVKKRYDKDIGSENVPPEFAEKLRKMRGQTAYRRAGQAYEDENWEKAIGYFEIFVENDPHSSNIANAYYLLAACNEKLGNVNKRMDWLEEYVKVEKRDDVRTAVQLGLAFMRQKRGFAEWKDADSDPDPAQRAVRKMKAMRDEFNAVSKFQTVANDVGKLLADGKSSLSKEERDKLEVRREQALFLIGENFQKRQPFDTNTLAQIAQLKNPKLAKLARVFKTVLAPVNIHTNAIAGYEAYLKAYPKGKYGPQALMRIGTIYTIESRRAMEEKDAPWADACAQKSKEAFVRLQNDFPESDEAKNSVPRLAKTLIEMGLPQEGAAVYRQMLLEGGKYTLGQFLQAGHALLEAGQWQDAADAYAKVTELAASLTNSAAYLPLALMGQARAEMGKGPGNYDEARDKLDEFIEKYGKSALVTNAYDMLVDVAVEIGRTEKDDMLRAHAFNTALGALKKLRPYREAAVKQFDEKVLSAVEKRHEGDKGMKDELWAAHAEKRRLQNELTDLDFRRLKVFRAKLKAEQDRPDEAAKTRTSFIGVLTFFRAEQDPFTYNDGDERKTFVKRTDKFVNFDALAVSGNTKFVTKEEFANLDGQKAREDLLSPEQCERLEFSYGELLPLMVEQGLGKEDIEPYFDRYMELFGANGAYKKGEHYGDVENIRSKVKGN